MGRAATESIAFATAHPLALVLLSLALLWLLVLAFAALRRAPSLAPLEALAADADLLVLHASQTGNARELAIEAGERLRRAGRAVHVRSLGAVTAAELRAQRHVLVVAATTGDGDAPDEAQAFVRDVMRARALPRGSLGPLRFGLLALGDSRYADFCGFARGLDHWLAGRGARPLFERIEVDGWEHDGVARWHAALGRLAGDTDAPALVDAPESASQPWRLVARRVLNPGSLGEPMLLVELAPADGAPLPPWAAGDLARLLVPGQYRPRDYSIASLPADGRVHLVVRRVTRRNGTPGAASGWLADAPLGAEAPLQLVAHPSFRLGDNARRPLVLIASGSGIAGPRAHLRARAHEAGLRHWLIFGERQRAHDFLLREEIEDWQARGVLQRVDLAFSRDAPQRVHVQQLLRESAATLREWVADGAAIYVCGSRAGMGEGVHDALIEVLGAAALQALAAQGRYRRDVY